MNVCVDFEAADFRVAAVTGLRGVGRSDARLRFKVPDQIHDILATGDRCYFSYRQLTLLLSKLFYEHCTVAIFQKRWIEILRLTLKNVLRDPDHFIPESNLRNIGKILFLAPKLMCEPQGDFAKAAPHRFNDNWALAIGEHYSAHAYDALGRQRIPNDSESLLADLLARGDVVGSVVIAGIDLLARYEPIKLDGPVVFDPGWLRRMGRNRWRGCMFWGLDHIQPRTCRPRLLLSIRWCGQA